MDAPALRQLPDLTAVHLQDVGAGYRISRDAHRITGGEPPHRYSERRQLRRRIAEQRDIAVHDSAEPRARCLMMAQVIAAIIAALEVNGFPVPFRQAMRCGHKMTARHDKPRAMGLAAKACMIDPPNGTRDRRRDVGRDAGLRLGSLPGHDQGRARHKQQQQQQHDPACQGAADDPCLKA